MQNKDVRRPYFSIHSLPQTQKQVRRSRVIRKTNVKLKNINVAKPERSRSTPHSMRFTGKFQLNSAMFRSQHQQKSIKEAPSPTRQSKLRFGRNTLKLSLQLVDDINSPPPTVIVEPEEVVKDAQRRRSCDCTECGKQTIFQKDTMNYGVRINQVMREQESAINKFKRSIRKQQTLLFPQFLNTPKNSNNNNDEFPLEEIEIMRDDVMIKSFAHRPTLSNFVFEEQITINKSNTLHTERPKASFFESFLQKQKQITNQEKTQFTKQKILLDSLHNRCNFLSTHIKIQSPQVLTPRSPASLIMTSFPSTSPVKRKQATNIYLQPQKSKFFKTNSRITTLPEVPQQI